MVASPNDLRKTFPEAECLQRPEAFPEIDNTLKRHTAIYGEAKPVLTEVGVSESVPFQMKAPVLDLNVTPAGSPSGDAALAELVGEAAPASKTRPASRPPSVPGPNTTDCRSSTSLVSSCCTQNSNSNRPLDPVMTVFATSQILAFLATDNS